MKGVRVYSLRKVRPPSVLVCPECAFNLEEDFAACEAAAVLYCAPPLMHVSVVFSCKYFTTAATTKSTPKTKLQD